MGWQDIDLFEMEASEFSSELHEVIVPLVDQGSRKLEEWEKERKQSVEKMLSEADDEDERQHAFAIADLEGWRNTQRGQVLGAAGLHYLYSTLKRGLNELTRYFKESHPRAAGRYEGKSDLDRFRNEYIKRFGVDFAESSLYKSMIELALARNAGIHPDSGALREYSDNTKTPRFSKDGEFIVERATFLEILGETEKFFEWVAGKLSSFRKASYKSLPKGSDRL